MTKHLDTAKNNNLTSAKRVLEVKKQRLRPSQALEALAEIPNPVQKVMKNG